MVVGVDRMPSVFVSVIVCFFEEFFEFGAHLRDALLSSFPARVSSAHDGERCTDAVRFERSEESVFVASSADESVASKGSCRGRIPLCMVHEVHGLWAVRRLLIVLGPPLIYA